jgi:transposase
LGFTPKEAALAEAVVCGRLVAPGSELSTWKWIRKRSSIGELTESPLDNVGRNAVYRVGDRLWEGKDALESHLRMLKEAGGPSKDALYLFDLTNFYFEGQSLGNALSARGKSKERRSDAPLVSLGLVVDSEGFPVMSEVFPGNISEPSTLEGVLSKMGFRDDCLPGLNPTLAMDRGIATAENVEMLKAKGFPYVLITRGPRNSDYLDQFENRRDDPSFESFERDGYAVHLKKILHEDGTAEVLCVSDKKLAKEESMKRRWIDHAMEDFARLQKSVRSKKRGSVRKTEKVAVRIGRLSERYPGLSKYFKWEIVKDPKSPDSALDLTYERIPVFDIEGGALDPLSGTYVIESTHGEKSAEDIWRLYMTLTKVEKAFRSMKSDLGTRPIYHQKAIRTEAHLFISVMAFHLLCHIERSLRSKGINREWRGVRTDLSTHQRSTIIIQDEKSGGTYHVRVSGTPEASHESIYRALGIKSTAMRRKFFIARL